MRRDAHAGGCAGLFATIRFACTMFGGLREGVSNIERALDEYQRALDDVRTRNGLVSVDGLRTMPTCDLAEEDWEIWDSCQARIDATVETCRNLGFDATRLADGSWHVAYGSSR